MGYSTQQITEKGKPTRWRVSQTITVDASDFTAAATLLSKLQDENGLLLSSMSFSITDKTRRDAEDSVTQQAIKAWQARAQQAATGARFRGVARRSRERADQRPAGRVPMMRAQPMARWARRHRSRVEGGHDRRDRDGVRRRAARQHPASSGQRGPAPRADHLLGLHPGVELSAR